MTTTPDDVTKKIKAEPLAEHPAEKTVLTESVGEVACAAGPGQGRSSLARKASRARSRPSSMSEGVH
jgi:hypothetical protein